MFDYVRLRGRLCSGNEHDYGIFCNSDFLQRNRDKRLLQYDRLNLK